MTVLGKVSIRTATLDDLPELEAHPPVTNIRSCHHADHLESETTTVLVAAIDDRLCAHVNIRWTGFRLQPFATDFPKVVNMNGLAVWPEEDRNRGVGSTLITEVEKLV